MAGWLLVAGILLALMLWRVGKESPRSSLMTVHRTPLLVFLGFYVLLYTVVQPFLAFNPLDIRDAATMLCLFQPWLFGSFGRMLPRRWSYSLLYALVGLNVALAFYPVLWKGLPFWVSLNPPQVHYVPDRGTVKDEWLQYGLLTWLMVRPVSVGDLPRYHPQLYDWMQSLDAESVVLTNGTLLFDPYIAGAVEHVSSPSPHGYVTGWLKTGTCASQHNTVIVLFDWDYLAEQFAAYQQQVEQKCAALEPLVFPHSVVYQLYSDGAQPQDYDPEPL
jgi:hypothetical protein